MTSPTIDAKTLFSQLTETFAGRSGVTLPPEGGPRRFGSTAIRVDGQIFAMLSRGLLTLKLPPARVSELIADGIGAPFRKTPASTPWAEWVAVREPDPAVWIPLAEEALAHVSAS